MSTSDQITVWRLMTHHKYPEEALQWAIQNKRLAIGWGAIGDIRAKGYASPVEVSEAIKEAYPGRGNAGPGGVGLYHFYSHVRSGDLVILKAKNRYALVMEVTGDYEYKPTPEAAPIGDYQHQRKAKVLPVDAESLWHQAGSKQAEGISVYSPFVQCRRSINATTKEALSGSGENKAFACSAEIYTSADEVDEDTDYQEGTVRQVTVNAYERNPQPRRKCIAHHGARCIACKLDFGERYGKAGANFIHVHHLRPLSDIGTQYKVNPIGDLRPVCPNCHAVIHRRTPPYSIEEIQEMLQQHS